MSPKESRYHQQADPKKRQMNRFRDRVIDTDYETLHQ